MSLSPLLASESCTVATCRRGCALEVVDGLLCETGTVRGEEVDALLDLRWLLRHREDAEATLFLFCQLRRAMEERYYLAFYRLRRWLEHHIEVNVFLHGGASERKVSLKLDRYCIEAIRHQCLQSALEPAERLSRTRVRFVFRPVAYFSSSPSLVSAAQASATDR
jgi:hypothetical protein